MKLKGAIKQLKRFLAEDEDLYLVGHDNTTGIDIHFNISSIRRENNAVVLRGTNKSSQHLCLIKKIKTYEHTVDIPVENWDCPYVKEIHKLKILKFLKEGCLGEGDTISLPRGFTPPVIRRIVGGTEEQMRESLTTLRTESKIVSTGITKSMKFCHADYKQQAEENLLKENTTGKGKKQCKNCNRYCAVIAPECDCGELFYEQKERSKQSS